MDSGQGRGLRVQPGVQLGIQQCLLGQQQCVLGLQQCVLGQQQCVLGQHWGAGMGRGSGTGIRVGRDNVRNSRDIRDVHRQGNGHH